MERDSKDSGKYSINVLHFHSWMRILLLLKLQSTLKPPKWKHIDCLIREKLGQNLKNQRLVTAINGGSDGGQNLESGTPDGSGSYCHNGYTIIVTEFERPW